MNGDGEMVTQHRMCVQGAEEGCQEERRPQEECQSSIRRSGPEGTPEDGDQAPVDLVLLYS